MSDEVCLRQRIKHLEMQIEPLAHELAELNQKLRELRAQFKIGDVIKWSGGIFRGRITAVRPWVCGDIKYIVTRIRKDGSDGAQNCEVFSYHKPELA